MRLLTTVLVTGTLASFGGASALAADLGGTVKVDGSSTVFPITEAIAEEFQKANQKVKVTVGVSGTGGGYKKFVAGETDINDASRPIKAEEIALAKTNGVDFLELPVAYDGITIVVNPKNTWAKTMTKDQLKKLWEPASQVKTWKDLDASWPAEAIKLYGPGADSGTFEFFTEVIVGKAKSSRNDYTASEDDNALVNGVAGDKNALGYFGYAYFVENQKKLHPVGVDAGKGAITPADKTIGDLSYPLSRLLFLCINKKSADRPELDAFVKYYLKNAKEMSKAVGYMPLQDTMYAEATKRYESRKLGTWTQASH